MNEWEVEEFLENLAADFAAAGDEFVTEEDALVLAEVES